MFELSRHSALLDYFRIPSRVDEGMQGEFQGRPVVHATWDGADASLCWLDLGRAAAPEVRAGAYTVNGVPFFGSIVPDSVASSWLNEANGAWTPVIPVFLREQRVASIWRDERGSVFLPFDPDEIAHNFWSEAYRELGSGRAVASARSIARRAYYLARPVIRRRVQIALRRALSRFQSRATFPRWPIETALHDLYDLLLSLAAETAGEPLPYLGAWPSGYRWAFVLTHDVETRLGHDSVGVMREIERQLGYRSSWNFVPLRYAVDASLLDSLHDEGCEIGVHGLRHDGLDLGPERIFARRLPEMQSYRRAWGARGFRAPATQRDWARMARLGFDYDSSYPDTDPYEPQAGGCCSWLPVQNEDVVELPITLPQDYTLFVILRHRDGRTWVDKALELRRRGGLALMITHPDYVVDGVPLEAYRQLLELFADDETAWRALPREISAWWRRRAASRLERGTDGWTVIGPAAGEAVVALTGSRQRESMLVAAK